MISFFHWCSSRLFQLFPAVFLFFLLLFSSIVVSGQVTENPVLLPETYEIDSVIIRAGTESRNLMEKPYTEPNSLLTSISKISREDIHKQGATNVIEAMNHVPGGLIETRGRQVKQFFSIRGQKYPYPDYAIDGVWQKEFEELPYFFSSSDIEEIEIVRSSAALLTGLSGMSGIINIKLREYTDAETNVELEYGSYNNLHTHLSNGNKIGNFSYSAGIGYDKNDGPAGKHANEEISNFFSQFKWEPGDKITLKANIFYLKGMRELRIAELPAARKYRDMIQNFDPLGAVLSNIKMIYRPSEKLSSELQLFYSYRNPTFNDEVKETSSNEKDSEAGINFIQSVELTRMNILRFGFLYNHWIAPNGKRFYTGKRCDTETFSGVVVDEHRIGPLTLNAGIRWTRTYLNDYGAFSIEGDGSQFKNVTPVTDEWEPAILQGSFGASYRVNNWFSLFLNSSAGQIKPVEGSLNEDLNEPLNENRYKIDVGLSGVLASTGKITATAFGVFQKNAIVLSGETLLDTTTNIRRALYLNRNQNQYGLELELLPPRVLNLFEPFLNFTLMNSLMMENGSIETNKENPVFITSGGLYMEKIPFDFNLLCKYVSPFENDRFANIEDGPQALGNYFTADVTGAWTTHGKIPVRMYFKVRNLTDKRYSTVIGYPDFGRMIYVGIQLKIGGKE